MKNTIRHWRVECSINGKVALAIESASLCGRDLSLEEEQVIREMAENLLAFVGKRKETLEESST